MGFLPPVNVFAVLYDVLQILFYLIVIEVIVSWAIHFGARGVTPYHPWVRALRRVTEPLMTPFRRLIPPYKTGGLDLSPMLVLIIIQFVQQAVGSAAIRAMAP